MKKFLNKRWAGPATALLGLSMILLGVYRGEVAIVLAKAIRICMECIGIG